MGGRRGVTILSHRSVTSSDLKQDRLFFRESVSTFLQLVVASNFKKVPQEILIAFSKTLLGSNSDKHHGLDY